MKKLKKEDGEWILWKVRLCLRRLEPLDRRADMWSQPLISLERNTGCYYPYVFVSACSSDQMGLLWWYQRLSNLWSYGWILRPNDLAQGCPGQEAKSLLFHTSAPHLQWSSCTERSIMKTRTSLPWSTLMFEIKFFYILYLLSDKLCLYCF